MGMGDSSLGGKCVLSEEQDLNRLISVSWITLILSIAIISYLSCNFCVLSWKTGLSLYCP